MLTTDLSLKFDPEYRKISERFLENPEEFEKAFARAWFKLTHRDMGPRARYLGDLVPDEVLIWQDPIPAPDYKLINNKDSKKLKTAILETDLSVSDLVRTAWASAGSFRDTDMRGGANGARVRLSPQKDWAVNDPASLETTLSTLETVQRQFNESLSAGKQVSLADVIVLGGAAAIEKAAQAAGYEVEVPFRAGRGDASQEQTSIPTFAFLEPEADAFRNYISSDARLSPTEHLIDRADTLTLTAPEMSVLVAGMRALDANADNSKHGVFTTRPGTLSNDFFVNLLDLNTKWKPSGDGVYEGFDRATGERKWTATEVDTGDC